MTSVGAPRLLMRKSARLGTGVGVRVAVLVGVGVGVGVFVGVGLGVFVGVDVIKIVVAWAALLAGRTSFVVVTFAVLRSVVPVALTLTRVLPKMVTTPPTFRVPTVPVNAPAVKLRLLFAPLNTLINEEPLKLTPAGSRSLISPFCAVLGPTLVTTIV